MMLAADSADLLEISDTISRTATSVFKINANETLFFFGKHLTTGKHQHAQLPDA